MDDELETLVLKVRADTAGLERDVGRMRNMFDGPLAAGAERAGDALDRAMGRFIRNGKLGFDDLKRVALSALAEIAAAQVRAAMGSVTGGKGGIGGLIGAIAGPALSAIGLPGRATGGPVAPGRAYIVGERGPELFVPTSSGRIDADPAAARPVAITVNVAAPREASPELMRRSGRQAAQAVRAALAGDAWR